MPRHLILSFHLIPNKLFGICFLLPKHNPSHLPVFNNDPATLPKFDMILIAQHISSLSLKYSTPSSAYCDILTCLLPTGNPFRLSEERIRRAKTSAASMKRSPETGHP